MTSLPLFRPLKPKAEAKEAALSVERAQNALTYLQRQRATVDSIVKSLGERSHLNNFGDEVMLAFTPRRIPSGNTSPRPLRR